VSTPYGYQPDPNQGGQGGQQYDATQFAPAPQFGQGGQQAQPPQPQAPQYGQPAPAYGQATPQYGQPAPSYGQETPQTPQYGQATPQYGQAAPQYGAAPPQYGQAPAYGQATPQYGQAPGYGQAAPQYGAAPPQYGPGGYGAPASPYGPYPAGLGGTGAAPGSYLAGGPATFGQAVTEGLKNTFTWRGRASRSAFWWLYLATGGVNVVLYLLLVNQGSIGLFTFGLLVMFAIAFPSLGALVRRLHDTGRSGWYYWMSLIPIAGPILLLIALCEAPNPGPNQYG
jgi:uncharacterized membrane protein YhaH (DUF805 family)